MAKGMPKVHLLDPFSDPGPPRVDCFCLFGRFGAKAKKHIFPIGQKAAIIPNKMAQGSPDGRQGQVNFHVGYRLRSPGASGRPRVRQSMLGTRLVDQRARWQGRTDSWPEGKSESWRDDGKRALSALDVDYSTCSALGGRFGRGCKK